MADWTALLVVASLLYLIECLAWVESAAWVCFDPPLKTGWKCTTGEALPGNDRGGAVLVNPLRVSGAIVVGHRWPFSMSPDGLTDATSDDSKEMAAEPRYVSFDEIETVRADLGEIRINGERFVRLASSSLALHLADQIERVWKRPTEQRASEIEKAICETLDSEGAVNRWALFQQRVRPLAMCCAGLLCYAFAVSPLILLLLGPYPSWPYLLVGLVIVTLSAAIMFHRTHVALYPRCPYDRWVNLVSMTVFPVAAIRCMDKLSRDALQTYSSVVVAPLLCGIDGATPFLRRQLIDLRARPADTPVSQSISAAEQCAAWFKRAVAVRTQAALEPLRVDILRAPRRGDESMTSYCPRCHAQFGSGGNADCVACPGIMLMSFDLGEGTSALAQAANN
jgi:hypothetical protein